jgi:hypothetical protein
LQVVRKSERARTRKKPDQISRAARQKYALHDLRSIVADLRFIHIAASERAMLPRRSLSGGAPVAARFIGRPKGVKIRASLQERKLMSGHGHVDPSNKKVALLISVLAVVLAFAETLGKGAQTNGLSYNIEASNLWAFYQAKTIRMTTLRTAAESAELDLPVVAGAKKEALGKKISDWKSTAARYDSEPETGEGRKELAARAKAAEAKRDRALGAYHQYEFASALVQLAIVLASAHVITGVVALLWISGALGIGAVAFCLIGFLAPMSLHLF